MRTQEKGVGDLHAVVAFSICMYLLIMITFLYLTGKSIHVASLYGGLFCTQLHTIILLYVLYNYYTCI